MSAPSPSAAPASTDASAPSSSADAIDPQLYLQELSLQDCTCSSPSLLPSWKLWSNKSKAGKPKAHPAERGGHAAVWIAGAAPSAVGAAASSASSASASAGSVILFGGSNRQAVTFADTWRFDCSHTLVYDSARHRVLLYGGQQLSIERGGEMQMKFCRDVWSLDCTSWAWTKLPDRGDAPQRNGHTAVLFTPDAASSSAAGSSIGASMLVFGGSDAEGPSDVLWRYDLASHEWSRVATVGPPPEARELHASCVVTVPNCNDSYLIVSGGRGVGALLNSCYALRLPSAAAAAAGSAATGTSKGRAWEWVLVGQCPARCAHSLVALNVAATAPVLPMLQPQPAAAPAVAAAASADSSSAAPVAAAAAPASLTPPSPSSVALLLYGGTDGAMFYNDALLFWFDSQALDLSLTAPSPPCPRCQGPPGWTLMQAPENKETESAAAGAASAAAPSAVAAAASAGSSASDAPKAKSKKKKKKTSGADVQPPTSFAHTLTPLPCASPAFAAASSSSSASGASSSSSSAVAASVPGSFLLFGGMNDEADLDQTHVLAFVPLL